MPNEKIQIHESLKIIEITFPCSGIYLGHKRNKVDNLLFLINFVSINTLFIVSMSWCIKSIAAGGIDYMEIAHTALNDIFVLLVDLKSIAFLIYDDSINELMAALKNLENEEYCHDRPDGINKMIKSEIGFLNKVLKIYVYGLGISTVYFLGQPAFEVALNYFINHELKLSLPALVLFPFDSYDIRFWPFVYVHQIWSISAIGFQTVASDGLFFICCTYIRISFITLGHDFEAIIEKSDRNSQFHTTDELKEKLASLVKRHQDILNAVAILENIYAPANLGNFLAYSLVLCINGFLMTKLDNVSIAIAFVNYLTMAAGQIFFICYFPDMLIDQSMQISDAVYNTNWYLAEKSFVKSLLIVHQRAQIPCKITGYGYVDINLLTFTKIVSTAWSYFSLLSAVYE